MGIDIILVPKVKGGERYKLSDQKFENLGKGYMLGKGYYVG